MSASTAATAASIAERVAVYSALDLPQARHLGRRFGLGVQRVRHLDGGMRNSSFLADTTEGPFVFSVLDSHDVASAQELGRVMNGVAAAGLPTPAPRLADTGTHVVLNAAGTPVMVRPHLNGAVVTPMPVQHLEAIGMLLARIHTTAPPPDVRMATRRLPSDWRARLCGCSDRSFIRRLEPADQTDELARWQDLPRGLTHGDLFADNLIHVEGTWHVIDWEYASVDAYVIDLGIAAIGLCRIDSRLDDQRFGRLLRGYERHRRLQPDERAALTAAVRHGALVLAYERWVRHNVDRPDPVQAHTYQELDGLAASLGTDVQA